MYYVHGKFQNLSCAMLTVQTTATYKQQIANCEESKERSNWRT